MLVGCCDCEWGFIYIGSWEWEEKHVPTHLHPARHSDARRYTRIGCINNEDTSTYHHSFLSLFSEHTILHMLPRPMLLSLHYFPSFAYTTSTSDHPSIVWWRALVEWSQALIQMPHSYHFTSSSTNWWATIFRQQNPMQEAPAIILNLITTPCSLRNSY